MVRIRALSACLALYYVGCSFDLSRDLSSGDLTGLAVVGTDGTPAAGAIVRCRR